MTGGVDFSGVFRQGAHQHFLRGLKVGPKALRHCPVPWAKISNPQPALPEPSTPRASCMLPASSWKRPGTTHSACHGPLSPISPHPPTGHSSHTNTLAQLAPLLRLRQTCVCNRHHVSALGDLGPVALPLWASASSSVQRGCLPAGPQQD